MAKQSQYQMRIYVNCKKHKRVLNNCVRKCLQMPNVHVDWVSPLESDRYKEYSTKFLHPLGLGYFQHLLGEYWPTGGPHWDALAVIRNKKGGSPRGILLCEAKSYPAEMKKRDRTRAKDEASIAQINKCLIATKKWAGASKNIDWSSTYYQEANRIAHLRFFREHLKKHNLKIPAWYIKICFLDDPTAPKNKQTSELVWREATANVVKEMGISQPLLPFVSTIYLQGCDKKNVKVTHKVLPCVPY